MFDMGLILHELMPIDRLTESIQETVLSKVAPRRLIIGDTCKKGDELFMKLGRKQRL